MGQQNSVGIQNGSTLTLQQQLPIGKVFKDSSNSSLLYFIKQYAYTSEQAFQKAFIKFSTKLTMKNQNILNLQKTNTKVENTFCSTFYKIILVFEYIGHTLQDELEMRNKQNRNFTQKQIWSILFHCTLALAHTRQTQGIQHSAIGLKDIRLSQDGIIKLIPTQMIGISLQHDQKQGTSKKLAMTILSCILMKQVSNQSNEYLEALIDKTKCSKQLKKVLYFMIMEDTTFKQVDQYLFKLANDENDSVLSGVSTPVLRSDKKSLQGIQSNIKLLKSLTVNHQPSSSIAETSRNQCNLHNMPLDTQDSSQHLGFQFYTEEIQNPDQNDDQKNIQRQDYQFNNAQHTFSVENNVESQQIKLKQSPSINNLQKDDVTVRMLPKKVQKQQLSQMPANQNSQNLYTDPKLLDLIKKDLEQIQQKGRASFGMLKDQKMTDSSLYNAQNLNNYRPKRQSIYNISSADFNIKPIILQQNSGSKQLLSQPASQKSIIHSENPERNNTKQIESNEKFQTQTSIFKQVNNVPKRTRQQQCFGNILDEDASFKKSKNHRKTVAFKQPSQSQVKKDLMKQNYHPEQISQITKRNQKVSQPVVNSNQNLQTPINNNSHKKQTPSTKLLPQQIKLNSTVQDQSQLPLQYVCQTYQKGQYKGYKMNGLRHGNGTFYYKQGGKYIGEWKQNKMNGKGTLYYPNDQIAYQGNWKDDQLNGFGTLYNEQVAQLNGSFQYQDWQNVQQYWIKYQGEFDMDNKQGKGKWYLSNSQIFEGHFKDDMVDGEGVLSRKNGTRVRGIWRKNKLIRLH